MEEDYFEIDVDPSLSYLIEEKLLSKGVNFEKRDRVTGVYSDPCYTFKISKKQKETSEAVIKEILYKGGSIKYTENKLVIYFHFFITVFFILAIIFLNVRFIQFSIYDYKGGREIWISVIVVFFLTFFAIYAVSSNFFKSKNGQH